MLEKFYVIVHPWFVEEGANQGDEEAIKVNARLQKIPPEISVVIPLGVKPHLIHPQMPPPYRVKTVIVCGADTKPDDPRCEDIQALALKLAGYKRVRIDPKASLKAKI